MAIQSTKHPHTVTVYSPAGTANGHGLESAPSWTVRAANVACLIVQERPRPIEDGGGPLGAFSQKRVTVELSDSTLAGAGLKEGWILLDVRGGAWLVTEAPEMYARPQTDVFLVMAEQMAIPPCGMA